MARASYIYLAYDAHFGRVVSAFTVKHEAITAIKRELATQGARAIELYRIHDGHWSQKLDQTWERVQLDLP